MIQKKDKNINDLSIKIKRTKIDIEQKSKEISEIKK